MFYKFIEKIGFFLSVTFLMLSIYFGTVGNSQFSFKSLIGTDGLTLYGSIMALLTMLSLKWSGIRKIFRFILLRLNISEYDYKVNIQLSYKNDIDVNSLTASSIDLLKREFNNNQLKYELNSKSISQVKYYIRSMASNFTVKSIVNNTSDEYSLYYKYSFQFDGVSKYSRMNRNIKIVTNMIEDLTKDGFIVNIISLKIDKLGSEANVATGGIIYNRKNVEIVSSNIVLKNNDDSNITINNLTGISLSSSSIIKFLSSYEIIQDILIS